MKVSISTMNSGIKMENRMAYNVLLAIGVDAYRVKVSDELFHAAGVDALTMGDKVSCKVHFNVFRDKVYFSADSVDLVVE